MGQDGPGLRKEISVAIDILPAKWRSPVSEFLDRVNRLFAPRCIILYGSMATGAYVPGSDIDLIVISEHVPRDIWERLHALAELYPPRVPIEALAYTPEEFERMIDDLHVTALDATTQGVPLLGGEYFAKLRRRTEALVAKGLRRGRGSWVWGPPKTNSEN